MASQQFGSQIKVRSQNSFLLDVIKEIPSFEGHLFALPILFVNLGGEMIYVIEHRLKAQGLMDRHQQVMEDVIGTIFRPRIVDELFKPQHLLSENSMRQLFQNLAHASIMSLNQDSMDKLLDLMFMTVKFEAYFCRYPMELIFCSLNHLDYIRDLVKQSEPITASLRRVYNHIDRTYYRMDQQNLILLRNAVLRFFQDRKTRLSVFLQNRTQKEEDGSFHIPKDTEVSRHSGIDLPGKIVYFKTIKSFRATETIEHRNDMFHSGCINHFAADNPQSTAFDGPIGRRGTTLGTNIFLNYTGQQQTSTDATNKQEAAGENDPTPESASKVLNASATGAAELEILARILGGHSDSRTHPSEARIELDFLTDLDDTIDNSKDLAKASASAPVEKVVLQKSVMKDIDLGLEQLNVSGDDTFDLLAEMDKAAGR